MDWTKEYFDKYYMKYFLLTQDESLTREQVNFVKEFFQEGDYLLDAGCGIGRHSLLLAADGFNIIGVDSSPLYIEKAKQSATDNDILNVKFLQMDLRDLSLENKFDGVLSLWSSFGYFDDTTNFDILKRFYRALKKNGKLLIDIENRDYILKYFIRDTFSKKDNLFIIERRKYHPLTSVVTTRRYIIGKNIYKEYLRHIRIYSATEMLNLYKNAGFDKIQIFGNYDLGKFTIDSKQILIIGERS